VVPSVNTINIGDAGVLTTTPGPPTDTSVIFYTDIFTLVNTLPPSSNATSQFTLRGRRNLVGINTGSWGVHNAYFSPSPAGGILRGIFFSGAVDNLGNLSIDGASGNRGGDAGSLGRPHAGFADSRRGSSGRLANCKAIWSTNTEVRNEEVN